MPSRDQEDFVPSIDSADNVAVADVVGNKSDTVGGNSAISLLKINKAAIDTIDGYQDVPTQDSAANLLARDVIGNKTDTVGGDSLVALNKQINADLGDYSAQTNLQSLLAALGVPDVAGKPLYTCLVTDRMDSVTYGLSAIKQAIIEGKNIWYVNSAVGVSGAGTQWSTAFKTITEAVTAASAGDVIKIRGEFDEGAAIDINKELTLIGENTSSNQYNTLIYSNGAYPLVFIEANNVKLFNLGFAQQAAQNTITIGDDPGEAWYKCHIAGCKFDGWSTSLIGIANGSNADAPDLHVENCLFRSFATGCISTETTRARFNNNIFLISGSTYGITHVPDGGNRPDTCILNNKFLAVDSTNGNGIVVTNTPTAGLFFIDGNTFTHFASPDKCMSKRLGYTGANNKIEPVIGSGTLSYLDAGATQTLAEVTTTTKMKVYGVIVDCTNLTQNGTLSFYTKVDGTNYKEVAKAAFTVATDDSVSLEINQVINTDFKFTWTEGGDEGAARDIPYRISYEALE